MHILNKEQGKINNIEFGFYYWLWFNSSTQSENILENNFNIPITFSFNDQSEIEILFRKSSQYFFKDFDPTGMNKDHPIIGEKTYSSNYLSLTYESNPTKKFYFILSQDYGKFFEGRKYSISNSFNLRIQPKL